MSIPYASMGFMGSVRFNGGSIGEEILVRAYSSNISAKQPIDVPDIVDSRIDHTLYSLKARTVDGDVSFPLVHEGISNITKDCNPSQNLAKRLWDIAAKRTQNGRLVNQFNVDVRYTDNTAYRYTNCVINTMNISVQNEAEVKITCNVVGGANSTNNIREPLSGNTEPTFLSPARIVTWNDFKINIFADPDSGLTVPGSYIRSFDVTLNNNVNRYYTLNNKLVPQDITAGKREVTGNLKLMGFTAKSFHDYIYTNQERYTSRSKIVLGYTLGSSSVPYWATALWGCMFDIESVDIQNTLVETSIPFKALGDCENDYEAISLGANGVNIDTNPSSTSLGGPTSPTYFSPL